MEAEIIKFEDVRTNANTIHAIAQNMRTYLDNIISYTNNLSNYWEGSASEYYIDKNIKLINNFDAIFEELENSVLYLAKVTEGYEALDEKIVAEICTNLNITEPTLNNSNIFS